MKIKRIVSFICAVCIITAAAFSATAVYGYDSADLIKYSDDIINFSVESSGLTGIDRYIDGYLADNAAILSEWMVIGLSRMDR